MDVKYDIMTLDPERIILGREVEEEKGHYNYKFIVKNKYGKFVDNNILISTGNYSENALMRQIYLYLSETNSNIEKNRDLLTYQLIYLDFEDMFKFRRKMLSQAYDSVSFDRRIENGLTKKELAELSWNEKLHLLFRNGFYIRLDETYEAIHYVPFESSSSMSRECRISFINEELKAGVEERLLLGMDLANKGIHVKPHKYFSYRGLYLSDGTRILSNDEKDSESSIELNEKTVIVIDDATADEKNVNVITAKEDDTENENWIMTSKDEIKLNPFDGEGIIHPDYARELNCQLYSQKAEASSYQIRMPFVKGMLHSVDYIKFFEKECSINFGEHFYVKDCFGIDRDLGEAKVILTKSMLKNKEWLSNYAKAIGEEDPMAFYFAMFKKYDHSLYVTRTNLNLHNEDKKIKLNYQCLNTLAVDSQNFDKMIDKYIDEIKQIETHPDYQREFVLGERETANSSWKYALSRNIDFLHEEYVKEKVTDLVDQRIKDIYRGNIRVSGEQRFLSGDLLFFLIHVLMNASQSFDKTKIYFLKTHAIKSTKFRMPNPKVNLNAGDAYGFLRNPHLSRNEECVLRHEAPDCYDEYFSHLSGIVMTAFRSLAPLTMGGADHDGDMVKIITDVDIIKAMRNAKKRCKDCNNIKPVLIPPAYENDGKAPDSVQYVHVKDTFGNQIGRISNLAIKLGEVVYSEDEERKKAWEDLTSEEVHRYTPADCTILTGLEIDSAKNGKHPRKNIEELAKQVKKIEKREIAGEFHYIGLLNRMKDREKHKDILKSETKKALKEEGPNKIIYGKKKNEILIPDYNEDLANIEKLMPMYYTVMYSEREKLILDESGDRFVFHELYEEEKGKKKELIENITKNYNKLRRQYWGVIDRNGKLKEQNWYGKAYRIVQTQYYGRDDIDEKIKLLEDVSDTLEFALLLPLDQPEYGNSIIVRCETIIDNIKEQQWIYLPESKRKDALKNILPNESFSFLNEEQISVLTNYSSSGHMLLYYIIQAIKANNDINEKDNSENKELKLKKSKKDYDKAYNKLAQCYNKAIRMKYSLSFFDDLLVDAVREYISEEGLIEYGSELYKQSDTLFWKVFDGKNGLKAFKEMKIVKDKFPYKKWEKDNVLPDVELCEDEEAEAEDAR